MKYTRWFLFTFLLFSFPLVSGIQAENLSVMYFENNSGKQEFDWMRKGLADMLLGDLSRVPDLNLVERENLNKILKEQSLSVSGMTGEQSIKIGQLLEARKLILGSYLLAGRKLRIDVRISDTESGKVIRSVSVEGPHDTILDLEKVLAGKLMDALGKERPEGFETRETKSVKAAEIYYEGLDLLDAGKAKEALDKFNEASAEDPTYAKPMQGIEDSYRFLKEFRKQRKQREISALYEKMEAFKRRLNAKTWLSYAEWLKKNSRIDPASMKKYQSSPDGQALTLCDVPARCVWHLMMTRIEAGDKLEEYFGETRKKEALYRENLQDAAKARKAFADDPVLSEVLYMELFSLHFLGEKKEVRARAEEFMQRYPDYRLIEFVEDWYEESL